MESITVLDLIDYIVWYATTRGDVLTPIRLVKFLYLSDLYYARKTGGAIITGWPWAFVHYGPYCSESLKAIDEAIQKGILEAKPFQSRYDGEQHFIYRSPRRERPRASTTWPLDVCAALEEAIRKWAGDTGRLLDYVYFETEPMLSARPRERLDFSTAAWPTKEDPLPMRRLPKEKILEGRRLLQKLREHSEAGLKQLLREGEREVRDAPYRTLLEHLEQDEALPEIEGSATLEWPSRPQTEGEL